MTLIIALITALMTAAPAHPAVLDIYWDVPSDSSIQSYRILYGTASGQYGSPLAVSPSGGSARVGTDGKYWTRLSSLAPGRTYYVAIKAVNATGASPASAEVAATTLPDSDGDAMSDAWESRYGLNPNSPTDAFTDKDGDGASNLAEYNGGSSPADPASTPLFVNLTPEGSYGLGVAVSPAGSGSVSPSGGSYASGAAVSLTATPAAGYLFDHWSGDASGTANPVSLTMSANRSVTAVFIPTYTLAVAVSGSGTVVKSPNKAAYNPGEQVSLTATPAAGYLFDHWSGDASGAANPLSLTMSANRSVTAVFVPAPTYTLAVAVSPAGSGSVSPSGGSYASGAAVSLTATAASGYVFDHWSGDASGTAATVSLTMSANRSVVAYFQAADPPDPPTHFPAPAPQPTWVDLQGRLSICGAPADAGCEVAAYDSQGTLCGQCTVASPGYYGWLHVYGDNPATPEHEGAAVGDTLTLRVWDPARGREFTAVAPAATLPVTWTQDGDKAILGLEVYCGLEIPLRQGWNLVSFATDTCYYTTPLPPTAPMLPEARYQQVASVAAALASIEGKYSLVRGFDQRGAHTFDPAAPAYVNDLTYLAPGYGYWIKATQDCTLALDGTPVASGSALALHRGWNLVGCWADRVRYCGQAPTVPFAGWQGEAPQLQQVGGPADLFPGLPAGAVGLIRAFDQAGGHTYDPALPAFSDLSYSGLGYGYWINMKADGSLNY
jgi:hypothetical protein